ncbi:MAG: Bifunctional IPC transferase and DIPP synthase [bacterium ADurb.Bin270]|nr:NTP transferase domain-containing protein [Myxococcales bacterium]OQA59176.1 MAG: Bifunctional IPC transferase and DIPP synthase [bacterium ADurb.Bin270]HQG13256.1 sugar phosphate nucleotidyltransferase [bacterium]
MQAIIMAAGTGSRLLNLTKSMPKAMVKVCERELIRYVMDFLDNERISKKILVTGFANETIESLVRKEFPETTIAHNPDFRLGNILSLKKALPLVDDDMLLMNADHIYPRRMFPYILKNVDGVTAICDFDRILGEDDMKVRLNHRGQLCAIDKKLLQFDCGYIGMTFCPRESLTAYKEAVASVIREKGNSACAENVLAWLGARSFEINICDASGMRWLEVDTQEDLARAEESIKQNEGLLR